MASGQATVKASIGLNVRKGAGTKYAKIGWLANGSKISYHNDQDGWLQISYNGKKGYVSKQYTSVTKASTGGGSSSQASASGGKTVYVTVDTLNVRSGAGTGYKVLGSLHKGKAVSVISTASNGWHKIHYGSGTGWISGKYVSSKKTSGGGGNSGGGNSGGGSGSGSISAKAQKAVNFANSHIGSTRWKNAKTGMTYCQGFVSDATAAAIGKRYSKGSAAEACRAWAVSTSSSNIPAGAAVYFYSYTKNGRKYGHVGLYVGGGQVVHVAGKVKKQSLSSLNSSGWCKFRAWGWNGGVPLK
ncbi:MAG: SH3 domain-containing protein [Proteobacteria bacterium]|nr:SH3 domain-containing protein [Pseudomonadota bacterium]